MTQLPSVLIAAPVHYREDCPEVLGEYLAALRALDYPLDRLRFWFAVNGSRSADVLRVMAHHEIHLDALAVYELGGPPDSRHLGGPRWNGATQLRLAFLRNLILERFAAERTDLLLMPDSDVILAPRALRAMIEALHLTLDAATVSLQIDNRIAEDHEPTSNATNGGAAVIWADDGTLVRVERAGACTIYRRSVLGYRFAWRPGYTEEHQSLFDEMRFDGLSHYLLRNPSLVTHRLKRDMPLAGAAVRLDERGAT